MRRAGAIRLDQIPKRLKVSGCKVCRLRPDREVDTPERRIAYRGQGT